jgi:hypothetical protein
MKRQPPHTPRPGDRVRFREALVPMSGVIVDELTDSYVLVAWDGTTTPSAHCRADLKIDTTNAPEVT